MSLGQKERFSLVIVGLVKGGVINAAETKRKSATESNA